MGRFVLAMVRLRVFRQLRIHAVVVAATVVTVTVGGCSVLERPEQGEVTTRGENTIRSDDGQVTVSIPGSSLSGDGRLSVQRVETSDSATGFSITLTGAELVGPAEIRLPLPQLEAGEPVPLVRSAETADGPRTRADNVRIDGGDLIVSTTHFSWWFVDRWNDFVGIGAEWISNRFKSIVGLENGTPPQCVDEAAAREGGVEVTSDEGRRAYWCLGLEGQTRTLKVVNARGYGVAVEFTGGFQVDEISTSDLIGNIAAEYFTPSPRVPGNTVVLLGGGDQIDLALSDSSARYEGVQLSPDGGAYALELIDTVIGLYTLIAEKIGLASKVADIDTFLSGEQCFQDLSETTKSYDTDEGSADYYGSVLGAVFSCAEQAFKQTGLGSVAVVGSAVLWVVGAIETVVAGFVGAYDSLDLTGYEIFVARPDSAATEIIDIVPVDGSGNPRSGWTMTNNAVLEVDCSYAVPALSSKGTDIVRGCGATANGAAACWVGADRMDLICANNPWEQTYLHYRSTDPVPTISAASNPVPEWIELDNGAQCRLTFGGSWPIRTDGLTSVHYYCGATEEMVWTTGDTPAIDTSNPLWTVKAGADGNSPIVVRNVVRAYFSASP